MVSSGGSGTSSAPNIPAPSGQLNPTPGGAAPNYPNFLQGLGGIGSMATGLTPQMIQQIQGGGYSPTPPPMMQAAAAPPAASPDRQRLANLLMQMQQSPERGFNAPRGRGGVGGGSGRAGGQGGSGGGLY